MKREWNFLPHAMVLFYYLIFQAMLGMQNVLQINHPESKGKELERGTEVRPSPTGRESSVLRETLCGVCFDHIMLGSEV